MQTITEIEGAVGTFGGYSQKVAPLASALGFLPVNSPEDQLAGPLRGGLNLLG